MAGATNRMRGDAMTNADEPRDAPEPGRRGARTIAEEYRSRWAPGHPDAQEAGDDGPHGRGDAGDARPAGGEADGEAGDETDRENGGAPA